MENTQQACNFSTIILQNINLNFRSLQPFQMAEEQAAVTVVQMHTVTLAVAEEGTVSTEPSLHPAAVAEGLASMKSSR